MGTWLLAGALGFAAEAPSEHALGERVEPRAWTALEERAIFAPVSTAAWVNPCLAAAYGTAAAGAFFGSWILLDGVNSTEPPEAPRLQAMVLSGLSVPVLLASSLVLVPGLMLFEDVARPPVLGLLALGVGLFGGAVSMATFVDGDTAGLEMAQWSLLGACAFLGLEALSLARALHRYEDGGVDINLELGRNHAGARLTMAF